MEYTEQKIDGEYKYKGIIVNVRMDNAKLFNGKTVRREVVEHPGGVCILPVDSDNCCYMVRQYRYPVGRSMLEAPAGKLEYGEDPEECAARELSEETGFDSGKLVYLGRFYTSPGISTECLHIYLALDLKKGSMHLDEDEFLNVEKHSLSSLLKMVMNGEIQDGKTATAILKAEKYIKNS